MKGHQYFVIPHHKSPTSPLLHKRSVHMYTPFTPPCTLCTLCTQCTQGAGLSKMCDTYQFRDKEYNVHGTGTGNTCIIRRDLVYLSGQLGHSQY